VVDHLPGSDMSVLKGKLYHGIVFHMRLGYRGRDYLRNTRRRQQGRSASAPIGSERVHKIHVTPYTSTY